MIIKHHVEEEHVDGLLKWTYYSRPNVILNRSFRIFVKNMFDKD